MIFLSFLSRIRLSSGFGIIISPALSNLSQHWYEFITEVIFFDWRNLGRIIVHRFRGRSFWARLRNGVYLHNHIRTRGPEVYW
jgi:hypothetical protein